MSGEVKDGGPAFPHTPIYSGDDRDTDYDGMTLRDWFAGQALAGLFNHEGWMQSADCDELARRSYLVADAMIAARSK